MKTLGIILVFTLVCTIEFVAGYHLGSIYKIDSDEHLIRDMMDLIERQRKLIAELEAKQDGP